MCDNTIQIRSVIFHNAEGASNNLFRGMEMKIAQDDRTFATTADSDTFFNANSSYSGLPFKPFQDPSDSWSVPFVTNHAYKIHWRYGLDFTSIQIDRSTSWETSDHGILLRHNNTDRRDVFNFTVNNA